MSGSGSNVDAAPAMERFCDGALTLLSGRCMGDGLAIDEPMHGGVKVVVVDGRLRYRGGAMKREMEADGRHLFVMADDGRHHGYQAFHAGVEQRFLSLQLDSGWLARELGWEASELTSRLGGKRGRPLIHQRAASACLIGLSRRIWHCPMQGPLRHLQMTSQLLALLTAALEPLFEAYPGDAASALCGRQLARLEQARRHLLDDIRQPPTLPQLAAGVGMTTRRLDLGFRRAFGETPAKMLREKRMQAAYQWLASGQYQVSEVAWMCGYGFTHFSTAFQKRFGIRPGLLRAR